MNTARGSFWEAIPIFKKTLESYRSYHQNRVNVALHIIGIPDIILSLFLVSMAGLLNASLALNIVGGFLALFLFGLFIFQFGWGGWRGVGVAFLGLVFAWLTLSGLVVEYFGVWLVIEGFIFSLLMLLGSLFGYAVSEKCAFIAKILGVVTVVVLASIPALNIDIFNLTASPWVAALVLFIMGFYYHVPGHKLFEGNKPALLDDVVQALLGAPQELVDILITPFRSGK